MSKAIVIKNANFSTNKLTTIRFGAVPCTGISLEEESYTLTDDTPIGVEFTVTPSNTTDTVSWSSSDETVMTVSNGTITPIGNGTATLTVTCGGYSDTATVVVEIEVVYTGPYAGAARANIATDINPNCVTVGSVTNRLTAYGSGSMATTYLAQHTSYSTDIPGIKLPAYAVKVKVSRADGKGDMFYNSNGSVIIWTKDEHNGDTNRPTAIKPISIEEFNLRTNASYTYPVPSGADSCFVAFRMSNDVTDVDAVVSTAGITIEFLSE